MLADASRADAVFDWIIYFGIVVGVVVVGVVVVSYIRRRLSAGSSMVQPEFTLESIRSLRDRGELTIAEYEALRQKVIDSSTPGS